MTIVISIFYALFGLVIGSFLNVVIYRLPLKQNLAYPASHCPNCDNRIKWYDNIPLLSFLFLRAKCRNCKQPISPRYFLVELITAVLFVLSYLISGENIAISICYCLIFVCLVCVAFIDFDHMIIFDRFNIALAVLGIVLIFVDPSITFLDRIIGFAGTLVYFSIFYFGSLLFLKREGIGFGDVKLMAVCGLILGWKNAFLAVLIGTLLGSIILLIFSRIVDNKSESISQDNDDVVDNVDAEIIDSDEQQQTATEQTDDEEQQVMTEQTADEEQQTATDLKEFAFAPFLCFGTAIALLFGSSIIDWYLQLFTFIL